MTKRFALIAPWPPQRTGIADYAFDLATGLAEAGHQVDVYTTAEQPLHGIEGITLNRLSDFSQPTIYDFVVYQMGNCSDFHIEQIPVLAKYPGIVHLHDLTLHHLIAFLVYRGDCEDYYRLIRRWYGKQQAQMIREHNAGGGVFWDNEHVGLVPFFEPVMEYATGCIVHSDFAKSAIESKLHNLSVAKIPQVYRGVPIGDEKAMKQSLEIGVFGLVQPHKHLDLILSAIAEVRLRGGHVKLHIAGQFEPSCQYIQSLPSELGIADCVTIHGHVEADKFNQLMRQVDVCISLRYPTMGETSAIVSRALQTGLPTIVNDVGWYAELPETVVKLPTSPSTMKSMLVEQLHRLAFEPTQMKSWRLECSQYAKGYLSFSNVISDYVNALENMSAQVPAAMRLRPGLPKMHQRPTMRAQLGKKSIPITSSEIDSAPAKRQHISLIHSRTGTL